MTTTQTFPRPDFARTQWQSLNGAWRFAFEDEVDAEPEALASGQGYNRTIQVPFCCQSPRSGIGIPDSHTCVWYARTLDLTPEQCAGSVLLKFGAVDYQCRLYINGRFVGSHRGGFTEFSFDIAPYTHPGENILALRVRDDASADRPRGKQAWYPKPDRCWYTPTTGIWRTVWVEFTARQHITLLRCLPDIDRRSVAADLEFSEPVSGHLTVRIAWEAHICKELTLSLRGTTHLHECFTLPPEDAVDDIHLWSPESPSLYSICFTLSRDGNVLDSVNSYFGMRKIEAIGGKIYLNHRPIYQRLILDQGYWADSLMTPPSEEALIADLKAIQAMGFNGLRMHQKNEDPLLYYHADRLGLLVWLEMPSAYAWTPDSVSTVLTEWGDIVRQNWNHPSIIAYVPFNESWGLRDIRVNEMQRSLANCAYHLTKALDNTRLVSTNDGWEFPEDTDFYGFHAYFDTSEAFRAQFSDWASRSAIGMRNRPLSVTHQPLPERPVLLTEFGGISLVSEDKGDWGYNRPAESPEALAARLREQLDAVLSLDYLCGYCYTQLTDVQQEINGLLTAQHQPKLPPETLADIFSRLPIDYQA